MFIPPTSTGNDIAQPIPVYKNKPCVTYKSNYCTDKKYRITVKIYSNFREVENIVPHRHYWPD
jgi:hypothetical protein